jgi:hypothetical protein
MFSPSLYGNKATTASADFCHSILILLSISSPNNRQNDRPPKVMRVTFTLMPAASTPTVSVQVSGFEDMCLLTHGDRLICDSCSSSQCFAFGFLQIPPRGGHPCRSANCSPCRVNSGLSPPSHPTTTTCVRTTPIKTLRAMLGAHNKKASAMLAF